MVGIGRAKNHHDATSPCLFVVAVAHNYHSPALYTLRLLVDRVASRRQCAQNALSPYLTDDSTYSLAQTGVFRGRDAIDEYIAFFQPISPTISNLTSPLAEKQAIFLEDADAGLCRVSLDLRN